MHLSSLFPHNLYITSFLENSRQQKYEIKWCSHWQPLAMVRHEMAACQINVTVKI